MEQTLSRTVTADRSTQREQILNGAGPVLDELFTELDRLASVVQANERTIAHQIAMRQQHEVQEHAAVKALKDAQAESAVATAELVEALRGLLGASMADPAGMIAAHETARATLEKYSKA